MAAYVIVDITVTGPAGYEEYKKMAAPAVAAHGGRYIVRGGAVEALEGDWSPKRLVVLEFEGVAQAKKWWTSEEYSAAKQLRHKYAVSNMIVVQGT
ncbi:MAG: DUF1330 domain-containing protein [Chloroflexi bacterium]|nr:DUF1330 domain-containing protein [Chloroflexota bacterium]